RTSCASHDTLTRLSRPENPPIPATAAFLEMIAPVALVWLETASVPPPRLLMYESASFSEESPPNRPPKGPPAPARPAGKLSPGKAAPAPGPPPAPEGGAAAGPA